MVLESREIFPILQTHRGLWEHPLLDATVWPIVLEWVFPYILILGAIVHPLFHRHNGPDATEVVFILDGHNTPLFLGQFLPLMAARFGFFPLFFPPRPNCFTKVSST